VQDAQAMLFSDRTTIVIAHRLTTIANASRVIVFQDGEIIEDGTHEELLALNGTFKSLYDTYYAHQGFEELTEETARAAMEEAAKAGLELDSAPVQEAMGVGTGMLARMSGHGPPNPEMMRKMMDQMTPEMQEEMLKRIESLPPEMRERIDKMRKMRVEAESTSGGSD
ncbi:MAG: hypothetical protein ACFFCK_09550, partial [Promethearchaeota archaeon]